MTEVKGLRATVYGRFADNFTPPKEFQGRFVEGEHNCIQCPFYDFIYSEKIEICNLLNDDKGKCPIYDDWNKTYGDEVMVVYQNFTEKEKAVEEVKPQVKDTCDTTALKGINKILKNLENSKEYLEKLTWEEMCLHKILFHTLLSNKIISFDEWRERFDIIEDAWHSCTIRV